MRLIKNDATPSSAPFVFLGVLFPFLSVALWLLIAAGRGWHPFVSDWLAFYTAGTVARTSPDSLSSLYYKPVFENAIRAIYGGYAGNLGWFYPPLTAIILAPFTFLSFYASQVTFGLVTFFLLAFSVKKVTGWSFAFTFFFVSANPVVWTNFICGQNGALTAFLGSLALYHAAKENSCVVCTIVFLGFLSLKPHLFAPVSLIFLFSRQYRIFVFSSAVAITLNAAAFLITKTSPLEWIYAIKAAKHLSETGIKPAIVSVYGMLINVGLPATVSMGFHIGLAVISMVFAVKKWRSKEASFESKMVFGSFAVLFFSPYILYYDLVWTVPIIAIFLNDCFIKKNNKLPMFPFFLIALSVSIITVVSAVYVHLQIATIVIVGAFFASYKLFLSNRSNSSFVTKPIKTA